MEVCMEVVLDGRCGGWDGVGLLYLTGRLFSVTGPE